MVARRYLLRLYQHRRQLRQVEDSLDPRDEVRLRELLEREVQVVRGTLELDLSDGWRLVVRTLRGAHTLVTVTVDPSGRTVIKR